MTNTYTDTAKQLIINDITDVDISTVTFNTDELYLAPDNAVYSVNNATPVNGNVTIDAANKDLSNLSTTGNAKFQAPITGGASTITSSNLTANKALISNSSGKVAVSSVTSSQLGYLSTVTSNVQTQLNNKQPTLVSGTNIKTINSTSLLGSGNIAVGTVTSVNNVSPVNGNVTLSIPAEVTESTVSGWGFIKSSALNGYATQTWVGQQGYLTSIPSYYVVNSANGQNSIAISANGTATANGKGSIALGDCGVSADYKFIVGLVDNNIPSQGGGVYELLDGTTGLIPDARISSNIARSSAIPTQASDIGAQEILVSGTNIKTVNNTSLLGSGNIIIPGVNNLFDFKWTDHLLNDQSWLQSNGSWCDGTVYSNAYNHLVADISGITAETETIAGYTVTFYRATDGHKICLATQETTVSDIYTATGIAWYYILDTTNTRFKFPRSEWGFVGYRDNVGNYIAPGLPDVQGSVGALVGTNTSSGVGLKSGAFADTTFTGTDNWRGTASALTRNNVHFKASKYNTIYGGSSTVQPPATQMYLYFYVGEFSQTATEQTAGLNSQLFNGKADNDLQNLTPTATAWLNNMADKNLSNLTDTGKTFIAHNAMPSTTHNNLTLGASGATYTAPADGWYWLSITASGLSNYTLTNSTALIGMGNVCGGNGYATQLFVPAAKGDTIQVTYQLAPSNYTFYFIYAIGAESEAS